MSNMKLKIRLTCDKTIAFGPGKFELLNHIAELGSISAAAKQMKMSYRRAWELVDVMNQCFKEPLVITVAGGSHGGGAQLTELGKQALVQYRQIMESTHHACQNQLAFFESHLR